MKQKLSNIAVVVAVISTLNSANILAADTGFYAYASAGRGESSRKGEVDIALINSGVAANALTSREDKTDTGYKIQLGYRFNRYIAIEGGYVNMGKFTYQAEATVPAATRDGNVEIDGWDVGVVGLLPVSDSITGFGKVGLISYDLSYSCAGTGIACSNPSRSADGTPFYYGLGLDWNFTQNWFARAEYEIFTDIGDSFDRTGISGTTQSDVRMLSLGLGYKF